MADHGDLAGEHGMLNKGQPYQSSAGIPFLISYPNKVKKGKVVNTPYTTIDFFPSILNLTGIEYRSNDLDGIDFSQVVLKKRYGGIQTATNETQVRFMRSGMWISAMTSDLKLVISKGDVPWLFDMTLDRFELYNFFGHEDYSDRKDMLLDKLYEELVEKNLMTDDMAKHFIYWNEPPICMDSNDIFTLNEEIVGLCEDIDDTIAIDVCEDDLIKAHCPVTCGTCSMDSEGQMMHPHILLSCDELQDNCRNANVMWPL
mmetsp:Transcript_17649/g.21595  ORF Transcript_17649/g.21595 Transcript_17649/m.21595 type:complete len:258 (+) Transcript_17649:2690-3463(+)